MSDETVTRVLHDLKVIAAIKENQRIYRAESGFLNIDNPSYLSSLYRFIMRENRHKNITDIVNVINDAFAIAENSCRKIESKDTISDDRENSLRQLNNFNLMLKIKGAVEDSSIGLQSLRSTYSDDTSLISRIAVVEELKNQSIKELSTSIQLLNSKYNLSNGINLDSV